MGSLRAPPFPLVRRLPTLHRQVTVSQVSTLNLSNAQSYSYEYNKFIFIPTNVLISACVSAPVPRTFRFDSLADASPQQQTRPSWSAPSPHLLPSARTSAYGQPSGTCRGGLGVGHAPVPLTKQACGSDGALAVPNTTSCFVNAEPKAIQQQNMLNSNDALCMKRLFMHTTVHSKDRTHSS